MKNLLSLAFSLALLAAPAQAAEPIKIGEMMPYTNGTEFAVPFREGYTLALEELNGRGGIAGRPLEVVSRDDEADPAAAVRVAEDLVSREKVVMLIGAGFDNVGLAVGAFANKNHVPFLKQWSGNCPVVLDPANKYWFSSTPCYTAYAAVYAREAAKKPFKRWATIAPNYEFGHVMTEEFKKELKRLRPDVEFVAEQYPGVGKINAAAEIRVLSRAKPEAIFASIFGADLGSYLLYAQKVDFSKNLFTISASNIGCGVSMRAYGAAYPKGWLTQGVPPDVKDHPLTKFIAAFQKKYGKFPDLLAIDGYQAMYLVAEALSHAKSLSGEDLRAALETVSVDGPYGHVSMQDKQIVTGWWLGLTDNQNGHSAFVDWTWIPAEELFPSYFQK